MAMFISYVSLPQGISENDLTCAGNKVFDFWEPLMNVAWITMKKWLHWFLSSRARLAGNPDFPTPKQWENHWTPSAKKTIRQIWGEKIGCVQPTRTNGGTTTQEHDLHTRTVPTRRPHDWEFAHYSDWIAGSQSSWHSSATPLRVIFQQKSDELGWQLT